MKRTLKSPRLSWVSGLGALVLAGMLVSGQALAAWPKNFGGALDDEASAITTTATGDIYVTGSFTGTIDIGPITLSAQGGTDVFVAKLRPDGAVIWARRFGGANFEEPTAIASDNAENAYVTGHFFGTTTLGGSTFDAPNGNADVFVLKLNESDGSLDWAYQAGGGFDDFATGIGIVPGNPLNTPPTPDSVFIAGEYRGASTDFGPLDQLPFDTNDLVTLPQPTGAGVGVFIARINADNGRTKWAKSRISGATGFEGITAMTVAEDGRIFITGYSKTGETSNYLMTFDDPTQYSDPGAEIHAGCTESPPRWNAEECRIRDRFPIGWQGDRGACLGGAWDHRTPGGQYVPVPIGVGNNNDFAAFLSGGANRNLMSETIDTSGLTSVTVKVDIIEGQDFFSEDTDYREDFRVLYCPDGATCTYNNDAGWKQLQRFSGGGGRTNGTFTYDLPSDALHADFKLRFHRVTGIGPCWYFWHVDNVEILSSTRDPFIAQVINAMSDDVNDVDFTGDVLDDGVAPPTAVPGFKQIPGELSPTGLAFYADPTGSEEALYLTTTHAGGGSVSIDNAAANLTVPGTAIFKMDLEGPGLKGEVAKAIAGANLRGTTTDLDGNVYVVGDFETTTAIGFDFDLFPQSDSRDIFVAKLDSLLNWCWATGGDGTGLGTLDMSGCAADTLPGIAGSALEDFANGIAFNPPDQLYLLGTFQDFAIFGDEQALSNGASDAVVANLDIDGNWFDVESWVVGEPIPAPATAELSSATVLPPEIFVDGVKVVDGIPRLFYWQTPVPGADAQLFPVQPSEGVTIEWRVSDNPVDENRAVSIGNAAWPTAVCDPTNDTACYQVHVAGAPVEINPADQSFTYLNANGVILPDSLASNAQVSGSVFTATTRGFATVVYVEGSTPNPSQFPVDLEVIRTVNFQEAPLFENGVPTEIGEPITDIFHEEPGRTGYVVNELAFYDGVGPDASYNRDARIGQIIPVNEVNPARPQDAGREMVVVWYRANLKGVFWGEKPVQYDPAWPLNPDRIIIASQFGGEVLGQQPLDPLLFESQTLYRQADPNLPGFNPNEEHAFFAPSSTGTGLEAIFALRADFGSPVGDIDAESDPWVLIKYFDPNISDWAFRVYRVEATGAGFNEFRFSGIAATPVEPPYPVRLLGGCAESEISGSTPIRPVPPPFFRDYKNQLWSSSEGAGSIFYYYPLQPGMDVDNPDLGSGDCVPWMPRLPEADGGTANPSQPIEVAYTITWPDTVPILTPGETLLQQKRGLPNIFNQAAVEVAFDEVNAASGQPDDTLAQLIDPLNPRTVELDALPSEVASELGTDGKETILGSSDGLIKLPVALRNRLVYDPLNGRLSFKGIFDNSGAGEPLLLLNVMSFADRDVLFSLDGGGPIPPLDHTDCALGSGDACTWDEAVQALFRLTRNPNGVRRVLDTVLRSVNDSDVLIAWEELNPSDPSGDGALKPFGAVGISPALTAGNAQGTGYMTLAFNNDPALNPAPVSLQVIRVDCIDVPAMPPFQAPYQGQLQVISPDNVFDEQLTLRHSGDFGGRVEELEFEWYFQPDLDGTPPFPLPDPDNGQLNGWLKFNIPDPQGAVEIVIEGANIQTLSDNWYVARYRGLPACGNQTDWSLYAGQPGATPLEERAQLAEGWVKRVLARLNPFEARVQNFAAAETNNFTSMLIQLGERYEGDIALNSDPNNLNMVGLIEAYQTVMRRALTLSVDSTPPVDYGPANAAILLVASRLVDFYTLLGNEAQADADDPTIGITTATQTQGLGTLAPTIFNFQNQFASLLEEELVLLRGRDNSQGPVAANPVYNRAFWNFTRNDGEVAYAISYNITDQNNDGVIDEFDARIQFPQGHGDAWGHYLTALDYYYDLLRHPFFSWDPRPEAVTVAGVPIQVDFLDERQFAETAALKAKVGAAVVDLTYRNAYVDDPAGQWQGYKDISAERAWGLSEWGKRAGQGAFFDWVTANAIVQAEEPDPEKRGIQRIDRTNLPEIDEISAQAVLIQQQVDEADRGLNPLGLAKGVVPFDIDPTQLDAGKTHFEQIFERATVAMENVVSVWDHANAINRMLRYTQNNTEDLRRDSRTSEQDYRNRLIEIFGYPYEDDIGPGGTYPAGYNGPDVYHYMLVDPAELSGTAFDIDGVQQSAEDGDLPPLFPSDIRVFNGAYKPMQAGLDFFGLGEDSKFSTVEGSDPTECLDGVTAGTTGVISLIRKITGTGCKLGEIAPDLSYEVQYIQAENPDFGTLLIKDPSWTGRRRAQGKIQDNLAQVFQTQVALKRAYREYTNLRQDIIDQLDTLQATRNVKQGQIKVLDAGARTTGAIKLKIFAMDKIGRALEKAGEATKEIGDSTANCIPGSLVFGFSNGGDTLAPARCSVKVAASIGKKLLGFAGTALKWEAKAAEAQVGGISNLADKKVQILESRLDLFNIKGDLDKMLREEPIRRAEVFAKTETMRQAWEGYFASLAEGQRVLEELVAFRKRGAEAVQQHRYEDMAFRIARNDALQKYRAAFDMAARYTYLAASAYDYETNQLGSNSEAGQTFLTDIVRERSIGQIISGEVVPGSSGLADPMARMKLNFDVLKGQMGFNNPQVEANRFSLRRELFRISDGEQGDADWRELLKDYRVPNLWALPEFRRYARPFAPESAGPQPALVIPFETSVSFGLNFFNWELGPGDSTYDPSQFATKVRSVGVWFDDYDNLPLANTPRVYMFPVGADILRSPDPFDFKVRQWQIVDQVIPVPYPLGSQDLDDPSWIPQVDSVIGTTADVRRFSRFRAYPFIEPLDESELASDSRLVGRSVWNDRWLLIIPGETLLFNPDEGLDTFIDGQEVPGSNGLRDGNGVRDILLNFKTYAYSGN